MQNENQLERVKERRRLRRNELARRRYLARRLRDRKLAWFRRGVVTKPKVYRLPPDLVQRIKCIAHAFHVNENVWITRELALVLDTLERSRNNGEPFPLPHPRCK
jgi:hypothetical protein